MSQMFTTEQREEYHGLYWEEVGKLVDGIEVDVKMQLLLSQDQCVSVLHKRIALSEWVTDNEQWAIHTLLWSKHACNLIYRNITLTYHYVSGDAFPFTEFALRAMCEDAEDKMSNLDWYTNLPVTCRTTVAELDEEDDEEEDDEEDDADDEEDDEEDQYDDGYGYDDGYDDDDDDDDDEEYDDDDDDLDDDLDDDDDLDSEE